MALPGLPASIEAKLKCDVIDGHWEPVDYMAARSEDDLRYALSKRDVSLCPADAWYLVGAEDLDDAALDYKEQLLTLIIKNICSDEDVKYVIKIMKERMMGGGGGGGGAADASTLATAISAATSSKTAAPLFSYKAAAKRQSGSGQYAMGLIIVPTIDFSKLCDDGKKGGALPKPAPGTPVIVGGISKASVPGRVVVLHFLTGVERMLADVGSSVESIGFIIPETNGEVAIAFSSPAKNLMLPLTAVDTAATYVKECANDAQAVGADHALGRLIKSFVIMSSDAMTVFVKRAARLAGTLNAHDGLVLWLKCLFMDGVALCYAEGCSVNNEDIRASCISSAMARTAAVAEAAAAAAASPAKVARVAGSDSKSGSSGARDVRTRSEGGGAEATTARFLKMDIRVPGWCSESNWATPMNDTCLVGHAPTNKFSGCKGKRACRTVGRMDGGLGNDEVWRAHPVRRYLDLHKIVIPKIGQSCKDANGSETKVRSAAQAAGAPSAAAVPQAIFAQVGKPAALPDIPLPPNAALAEPTADHDDKPPAAPIDITAIALQRALALCGSMRPDRAAVAALAERARAGVAPIAKRLLARDGESPLTAPQAQSALSFADLNLDMGANSLEAIGAEARKALTAATQDPEARQLAAFLREQRPRGNDPRALAHALRLTPLIHSEVQLPPRQQAPALGKLATIDPPGFLSAHVASCLRCARSRPCYGPALALSAAAFQNPWRDAGGPPASALRADIEAEPFNPQLAAKIATLLNEGTVEASTDVVHYSRIFLVNRLELTLTEPELADCAARGSAAAHDIALRHASAFLATYKSALASEGRSPSARAVRRAFDAATLAGGASNKPRAVIDLSALTPYYLDCSLRYTKVTSFMRTLRPGMVIWKCDLRSGYFQLGVHVNARRYFGFKIRLNEGAQATSMRFGGLPMGTHPACTIFSAVTGEVLRVFLERNPDLDAFSYLDDLYGSAYPQRAAPAIRSLKQLLKEMGLTESEPKTTTEAEAPTATSAVVLGVEFNTVTMTAVLPHAKLVKELTLAMVLKACAEAQIPVPEAALGEMGGRLVWHATVDTDIPAHTPTLAGFARYGHKRWAAWRHGAHRWDDDRRDAQLRELAWIVDRAASGALMGTAILPHAAYTRSKCVVFSVDFSGGANALAIVTELGALRVVLAEGHRMAVPVMELLAKAIIFAEYGELLEGLTVVIGCDAIGACHWALRGKAPRADGNDVVKLIRASTRRYAVALVVMWLTRWWNYKADRAAALPLQDWAATGVDFGLAAEITLEGLPYVFLKPLADRVYPAMPFSTAKWEETNARS